MFYYDNNQSGRETEEELSQAPSNVKKTYNTGKKIYENREAIKQAATAAKEGATKAASGLEKIVTSLIEGISAAVDAVLSAVGSVAAAVIAIVLIVIVIIIVLIVSIFNYTSEDLNKDGLTWDSFISETTKKCETSYSETYTLISNAYAEKQNKLMIKVEEMLVDKINSSEYFTNHPVTTDNLSHSCNDTNVCTITFSYENKSGNGEDGNDVHIYKTEINVPISTANSISSSMVDSIVGYIEANYAVINTYTADNIKKLAIKTTDTYTVWNKTNSDGETMTKELCTEKEGTILSQGCFYKKPVSSEKVAATGTCKFENGSWSTSDDETHSCSNGEWIALTDSTKTNPDNGETYEYSYEKTNNYTQEALEDFDLDSYKSEIQKYINEDKLFYFDNDETIENTLTDGITFDLNKEEEEKSYEVDETNSYTCTYKNGKWSNSDGYSCSGVDTKENRKNGSAKVENTTKKEIKYKVYTETLTIGTKDNNPIELNIHTRIDASDDSFLGKERKTTIENIKKLNKANDIDESAEYTYNASINQVIDVLNAVCPKQIDLSVITGATYSGFSAISGGLNTPEVFGNEDYWYDSSSGIFDYSQIGRDDVYQAIWSYAAYKEPNGTYHGNVSGWFNGDIHSGTPQCTDFVHARFFAQYGYQCGGGNGIDIARTTVALYPDKFYDGTDANGKLTIKPGSIISRPYDLPYGHVGFVEAVETDASGSIVSITISDANFIKCPGGVRLMCKYTWAEYLAEWGLNCTFAVPIN